MTITKLACISGLLAAAGPPVLAFEQCGKASEARKPFLPDSPLVFSLGEGVTDQSKLGSPSDLVRFVVAARAKEVSRIWMDVGGERIVLEPCTIAVKGVKGYVGYQISRRQIGSVSEKLEKQGSFVLRIASVSKTATNVKAYVAKPD